MPPDPQPAALVPIAPAPSGVTAFVGHAARGPLRRPVVVRSALEAQNLFGAPEPARPLSLALRDFFLHGGTEAVVLRVTRPTTAARMAPLATAPAFDLLCVPPDTLGADTPPAVLRRALDLAIARGALLLADAPAAWTHADVTSAAAHAACGLPPANPRGRDVALFMPRVRQAHPLRPGDELLAATAPSVAGLIAETDRSFGVWRAAAGAGARLRHALGPATPLNSTQLERLTHEGVNGLRGTAGQAPLVWGARTLSGAAALGDEFRYIPVRRLTLHIETSLRQGLQGVVFEPNDEPLWAQVRLLTEAFMNTLFRAGALQGVRAQDAYFLRCDASTTTAADQAAGRLNLQLGFAPLKPAEFIVRRIVLAAGPV
jgi:phage tail sheath protein FI